jgi:HEAT repeat protein
MNDPDHRNGDSLNGDGADGEDPGSPSSLPSPLEVIADLQRGAAPEPSRLRALSEPPDEVLRACLELWPALAPERRRELLAALEHLAADDATLDFHKICLTALRDPDIATRILAVRGLEQEERPEYMRLLAQLLQDDPAAAVRAEIANVLGQFVIAMEFGLLSEADQETLIAALRDAIENVEEQDEVRGRALESLGAGSDESTAELISEMYELGNHRLRVAALRAMGRNASDGWLDVLVYHFDDDDAEIRAVAAEAAGQLLLDEAVDPLVMLAQEDRDEDVQVAAIHALGEIANEEVERILSRWMRERSEPRIREAVREALAGVHLMTAQFMDERDSDPDFSDEEPLL